MNRLILLLVIAVNLTACTTTKPYQLGTTGEDGLAVVTNATLDALAIRPDASFGQYKKILIEPVTVTHSTRRHTDTVHQRKEDFQLDEKELAIFQRKFTEAFQEQLSKTPGWQTTDKPASDVITLRASITDLYLYASIKNGNVLPHYTLTNETSTMVLNLELLDSQSGKVLLRAKDKATTGWTNSDLSTMQRMSSVRYWSDVRQTSRQWAATLATYLN